METFLRVSGVVSDSIVDGPGLRLAVFTQGCPHACPGCHNPQSHDPQGGYLLPISDILQQVQKNPLLSGITLTGGEPLEQAAACLALVQSLPDSLSVWLYTGWTYEEVLQSAQDDRIALLHRCDVVVDGRFTLAERSLDLTFRGSRNQRLLDIPKTISSGSPILWTPPQW